MEYACNSEDIAKPVSRDSATLIQQPLFMPYWESRAQAAVVDDLLLYGERIVIPQALRLVKLYGTTYMVQQPHSSPFFLHMKMLLNVKMQKSLLNLSYV